MAGTDICQKYCIGIRPQQFPNDKIFIHFSYNCPKSNISDGVYTVHAKSWQLLDIHDLLLGYICENIPATALSSAICLTIVPLKLKKIFILCALRDWWETPLACVCLRKSRVSLCVRFLVLSLSTFQPIILQGKELWASSFQSPHSHLCFPMPAVRSHSLVYLTQDLDSHRFSFPQLAAADFVIADNCNLWLPCLLG